MAGAENAHWVHEAATQIADDFQHRCSRRTHDYEVQNSHSSFLPLSGQRPRRKGDGRLDLAGNLALHSADPIPSTV